MDRRALLGVGVAAALVLGCEEDDGGPSIAAPSNLEVTAFATSSVTLNWTDNSNNEDGFRIYRSTDGTNFSEIGTNSFPGYGDSTVSQGTLYYYRVTAYNATDESSPSNTVSVTPDNYYVTLLTPNGGETLTIDQMYAITWDTNMPGFDAVVYLSTDGGGTFPAGNQIQFSWAPNGSPYSWKVGYRNTSSSPLDPPAWEQIVFGTETLCVIRVEQYKDGTPADVSDAVFTIQP